MILTISSLVSPEFVVMTIAGAASDDNVGFTTAHGFQFMKRYHSYITFINYSN